MNHPGTKQPQAVHHSVTRVLLLLGAGATLALSASTFVSEYRLAFLLNGTANQQIEALSTGETKLNVPRSARSMRDALTTCGRLLRFAPRLKAEPELRPAVAGPCAALAEAILIRAPTHARARAVALLAGPNPSAAALRQAQAAAPYEPWPLSMRLAVIGEVVTSDPDWATAASLDLQRAMESQWGRDEVAAIYVAKPALRALIQRSAEGLSGTLQADFLQRVKNATRGVP